MQIIPVLDLLGGSVARAIGGRRREYRPVQSLLATNAAPVATLDAFIERFAFQVAYIADLDGIMGNGVDNRILGELARRPIDLIVDAGVESLADAQRLFDLGIAKVVAASESLSRPSLLKSLIERFSADQIVFSVDMNAGQSLAAAEEWSSLSPEEIVHAAADFGVNRFILLDLADVGEGQGPRTLPLFGRLKERLPKSWFAVGGGVRNISDVAGAKRAGVDAVLVASALHDGRITPDDIAMIDRVA